MEQPVDMSSTDAKFHLNNKRHDLVIARTLCRNSWESKRMADALFPIKNSQLRLPTRRTCIVAALMLAIAWVLVNSMNRQAASIIDISVTRHIVLAGAIPWCIQFVATLLVVRSCCRSRPHCESAVKFSAVATATIGMVWWVGVAVTYHGQGPLDAISQMLITSVEQQLGGERFSSVLIHRICGPLISIIQLRGFLSLAGVRFFYSLASLSLLTGYFAFTASVCHVGHKGPTTTREVVQFILMASVIFVPAFIRIAVDTWQTAP